jgi:predicted RNase H-like HicB family nuclease
MHSKSQQGGIAMDFVLDLEQEDYGRWIVEIADLPGVMAYGATPAQASAKAKALALRVLAERMEKEESLPGINNIAFTARGHGRLAFS